MKALFRSKIYHKRYLPRVNEFLYSGYYIKFSIEEMENLNSAFFSVNKMNLFSFYEKDHGHRDGSSLFVWAKNILSESGIPNFEGTIVLQTFPRLLGYVFNPVSFWYCYKNCQLVAIICEVNNTFGEAHNYVLKTKPFSQVNYLKKHFHVSPFYDIEGEYRFDFTELNTVKIDYLIDNKMQLATGLKGEEVPFNDKNLIKLFFRFPFFTMAIVFLIHFQALKLFLKKIKFYTKPKQSESEVTYE